MLTNDHASEVARGERFAFGANWRKFLETVDEARVREAERSLTEMLGRSRLDGLRFLDIGCGSGLFSLAAHRLGATVMSFDFDPESVACTLELRRRFGAADPEWTVEEGSVLDVDLIRSLGTFDIVYSWGVLHHTGNMERAFDHAILPVVERGMLFIAIYNDQGWRSRAWWHIKRVYCGTTVGRWAVLAVAVPILALRAVVAGLVRTGRPWSRFTQYHRDRGMSIRHDWTDWLGGFPFEYAPADAVVARFERDGFELQRLVTTRGWGCNQFVFRRAPEGLDADR